MPEPTSPISSRCIGSDSAEVVIELRDRRPLVTGEAERQRILEPARGQLARGVEHRRRDPGATQPAAAQQRQLREQQLVERQPAPPERLLGVTGEVGSGERAAAVGQPLVASQQRRQRLDDVGDRAACSRTSARIWVDESPSVAG